MQRPDIKPPKLSDFKARPPRVEPTKRPRDHADTVATKVLMDLYSFEDGFHCPRCGLVIPDGDKAVLHLAEEINQALARIGR